MNETGSAAPSLAGRAARSALWLLFGRAGLVAIGLATFVVMARLLSPEIYGAFALAALAMTLGEAIASDSFAEALVQRAHNSPAHVNAAFWLSVGPVAVVAAGALVAAKPLAMWLNAPAVADALPWMGLVAVLIGLGAVPSALLQRDLRQRPLVMIDQAVAVIASISGIVLAVAGAGLWSLVAMELTRAAVRTLALGWTTGFWPGRTSRAALHDIWHYGRSLVAAHLLQFADRLVPRLVIGLVLGAGAVGVFQLGWRAYELVQKILVTPLTALATATTARAEGDMALLRRMLVGAMRVSALIAYPSFVGAAAIAPTAVPYLFGPQWAPAVLPMQILMLIGLRAAISGFNAGILRGLGRPDLALWLPATGLMLALVLVPLAAPYGVAAVAAAVLLRSLLTWPIGATLVSRRIGLPALAQLRAGSRAAAASAVMAIVIVLLQHWLAPRPALPLLALLIAAGSATYATAMAVLAPAAVRDIWRAVTCLARGNRAAARAHLLAAGVALG